MSLCRACLSSNLGMYHIDDTGLHDKFESISKIKYKAGDGRPENVCYICCKLLQKFYDFIEMAQASEKIFKSFIRRGVEITTHEVSHLQKRNRNYCCSQLKPISIGGALTASLPADTIKKEIIEINRNTYAEYVGISDILNDFEDQQVKEDPDLETEESNMTLDDISLNFKHKLVSIVEENLAELNPTENLDQDCIVLNKKEEPIILDECGSDALGDEIPPLVIDVKNEKDMDLDQCETYAIEDEDSPQKVDQKQMISARNIAEDGTILVKKEKEIVLDQSGTYAIEDEVLPLMVGEKEINHVNNNAKDSIMLVKKEKEIILDKYETYVIEDEDSPLLVGEKEMNHVNNNAKDSIMLVKNEKEIVLDKYETYVIEDEDSPLLVGERKMNHVNNNAKDSIMLVKKEKDFFLDKYETYVIEDEDSSLLVGEKEMNHVNNNAKDSIMLVKNEKEIVLDKYETYVIEDEDSPLLVGERKMNHVNNNAKDGIILVKKEKEMVLDKCESYIIEDDDPPCKVDESTINPANNNAEDGVILVKKENEQVLDNCETYIIEDEDSSVILDEKHTNPINKKAQDSNILVKREIAVLDDCVTDFLEDGELPFMKDETHMIINNVRSKNGTILVNKPLVLNQHATDILQDGALPFIKDSKIDNITNNEAENGHILVKKEKPMVLDEYETLINDDENLSYKIVEKNMNFINNNAEDCNILEKKEKSMVVGECESDILEDGELPTIDESHLHLTNNKARHEIILVSEENLKHCTTDIVQIGKQQYTIDEKDVNLTSDVLEDGELPAIDEYETTVKEKYSAQRQIILRDAKQVLLDDNGLKKNNFKTKKRNRKRPRHRHRNYKIFPKKYFKPSEYIRIPMVDEHLTDLSEDEDSPLMIDENHIDLEFRTGNENKYLNEPLILSDANHTLLDDFGGIIDGKSCNNVSNGENRKPFYLDSDKSPRNESKSTQSIKKPNDEYLSDISDDDDILRMLEEEHIKLQSQSLIEDKYSDPPLKIVQDKQALSYNTGITNGPNNISGNSNTAVDKRREIETNESSETPLNCNLKFKIIKGRNKRKKIVSNSMIYECEDCDNTYFSRQDSLVQHMKEKHPCRKSYACTYCTNKFYICKHLMEHIRIHHADERTKLRCDNCGKKHRTHHRYLLHKNHCHDSVKEYSCDTCQKKYKDRLSFKYHVLFVHPIKTNNAYVF